MPEQSYASLSHWKAQRRIYTFLITSHLKMKYQKIYERELQLKRIIETDIRS